MGGFKRIIGALMITNATASRKKISSSKSEGSSSFPRLRKSKGRSDIELCRERLQLPLLAMQRWLALGDAYKKNCDLHGAISASIAVFIATHSEKEQQEQNQNNDDEKSKVAQEEEEKPVDDDATEKEDDLKIEEESVVADASKQEHNPKGRRQNKNSKAKKNRSAAPQLEQKDLVICNPPQIASSSNNISNVKAAAEKTTLPKFLKDLEGQKIEDEEMKNILETSDISTVSTKSSSHTLLRSWSRRLSSTFIPTLARSSRKTSSKVRSAPSDDVNETDRKHSSYLDELGQWENKLYEEIEKGLEGNCKVKVAQFVFDQIQQLRDENVLPHLDELLRRIQNAWETMRLGYTSQKIIMEDIKQLCLYKPPEKMYCEAPHNHAAKKLKAQLEAWRLGFMNYLSAQKEYVKALEDWGTHQVPSFCQVHNNNSFSSMLQKWIKCLDKMEDDEKGLKVVMEALDDIEGKIGELLELQKKEHEYKSQVQKLRQDEWNQVQKNENDELERLRKLIVDKEAEYEDSRKKTEKSATALITTDFETLFNSLDEFSGSVAQKYREVDTSKGETEVDDS